MDPEHWAEVGSDLQAEWTVTLGPGHCGSHAAQLIPGEGEPSERSGTVQRTPDLVSQLSPQGDVLFQEELFVPKGLQGSMRPGRLTPKTMCPPHHGTGALHPHHLCPCHLL